MTNAEQIQAAKQRIEELNRQAIEARKLLRKRTLESLKAEGNQLCRIHSARSKTEYIDLIIDCRYGCSIPALERKIAYFESH